MGDSRGMGERVEPERAADSEGALSAFVSFAAFGDTTAAR